MRRSGRGLGGMFATVALSAFAALPAQAAGTGGLDTSFGNGGIVVTDLGGQQTAYGVAVQPDGKIVAAGYVDHGGNYDFALTRYTFDGSPDPAFGRQGMVVTDLGGHDIARAVVLQPDGKIILAGQSGAGPGVALARYDRDGHLDTGFARAGTLIARLPGIGYAVNTQPDGKIVVAGSADTRTGNDIAVARFLPDGSPDPSFGAAGTVLTDIGTAAGDDIAQALALQPDGRILVAGRTDDGSGDRFALLRYLPDGRPDPSFGSNGAVVTDVGGTGHTSTAAAVAARPDGSIVVAGCSRASDGTAAFALAAYRPDGRPEPGFGTGGVVLTPVGGSGSFASASALAITPHGRIIVAGSAGPIRKADFALTEYHADGTPDLTFGDGGTLVTDINGFDSRAFAIALQPDGKVVAAGYAGVDFAAARYLGAGEPDHALLQ